MEIEINWWWVGLGVWVIAGTGLACLVWLSEAAPKTAEEYFVNIFVAMQIGFGAPIFVLGIICACIWMLAHGDPAFIGKLLWGKRSDTGVTPEKTDDTEIVGLERSIPRPPCIMREISGLNLDGADDVLSDMIELRRESDPKLDIIPCKSPEADILEIVELGSLLKFDGFTERQIIERIEAWRSEIVESPKPPPTDFDSYIKYRLECESPDYPVNDVDLFTKSLELAKAFAESSTRMSNEEHLIPSTWLKGRITLLEFDRKVKNVGYIPEDNARKLNLPDRRCIARMKLRMRRGDELRIWEDLKVRHGIALVREGEAIEYFVLPDKMNGAIAVTMY